MSTVTETRTTADGTLVERRPAVRLTDDDHAAVTEALGAVGDTIVIILLRSIVGIGSAGDILTVTETLVIEGLIAGGYAAIYSGSSSPIVPDGVTLGTLGVTIYSGVGVPTRAGKLNDAYLRANGTTGSWLYRCTATGGAGVATWAATSA